MAVRVRNGPGWDLLRSPGPDESYEWYEWYEFAFRSNFIAKQIVPAMVRAWLERGRRYEFPGIRKAVGGTSSELPRVGFAPGLRAR